MNTKGELLELVEKISDIRLRMRELQWQRRDIVEKCSAIRDILVIAINFEEDDKGRRKYTNEKLRQAALSIRLRTDVQFQELRAKRKELDQEIDRLAIEHNRLVDKKYILMAEVMGPAMLGRVGDEKFPQVAP